MEMLRDAVPKSGARSLSECSSTSLPQAQPHAMTPPDTPNAVAPGNGFNGISGAGQGIPAQDRGEAAVGIVVTQPPRRPAAFDPQGPGTIVHLDLKAAHGCTEGLGKIRVFPTAYPWAALIRAVAGTWLDRRIPVAPNRVR